MGCRVDPCRLGWLALCFAVLQTLDYVTNSGVLFGLISMDQTQSDVCPYDLGFNASCGSMPVQRPLQAGPPAMRNSTPVYTSNYDYSWNLRPTTTYQVGKNQIVHQDWCGNMFVRYDLAGGSTTFHKYSPDGKLLWKTSLRYCVFYDGIKIFLFANAMSDCSDGLIMCMYVNSGGIHFVALNNTANIRLRPLQRGYSAINIPPVICPYGKNGSLGSYLSSYQTPTDETNVYAFDVMTDNAQKDLLLPVPVSVTASFVQCGPTTLSYGPNRRAGSGPSRSWGWTGQNVTDGTSLWFLAGGSSGVPTLSDQSNLEIMYDCF